MKFLACVFGSEPLSPEATARERLHNALAARPALEQAVEAAQSALERVQDIIDGAEHAGRLANRAEAAAANATRAWSEAGAPTDVPCVDPSLVSRMHNARRAADAQAFQARGAIAALPKLRRDVEQAQSAIDDADLRLREAAGSVMTAMIEADLQELEAVSERSRERVARIWALRMIMHGKFGPAHHYFRFRNTSLGGVLEQRLFSTGFRIPSDESVKELSNEWVAIGKRLIEDSK